MPPPRNDLAARLRALSVTCGAHHALDDELDALLVAAVHAVPSCLAVTLTVDGSGLPVTVTALVPTAARSQVRASLLLRLGGSGALPDRRDGGDARGGSSSSRLVLHGSAPGAFDQLARDLLALLDLDPGRAALDSHLVLPDPTRAGWVLGVELEERSAVHRALGVLLDQGYEDARAELQRLAGEDGLPAAARRLLATVSRDGDGDATAC